MCQVLGQCMIHQKCYMNVNYCHYNDNDKYYYYLTFCNEFDAGFSPGTRYGWLFCKAENYISQNSLSWMFQFRMAKRRNYARFGRQKLSYHYYLKVFFQIRCGEGQIWNVQGGLGCPTQSSYLSWLLTSLTNSGPNPTTETSWDPQVSSYTESMWTSPTALSTFPLWWLDMLTSSVWGHADTSLIPDFHWDPNSSHHCIRPDCCHKPFTSWGS